MRDTQGTEGRAGRATAALVLGLAWAVFAAVCWTLRALLVAGGAP